MEICAICHAERPGLHKHHIHPKSLGGSNDPDNLIRICANCHEEVHGGPVGGVGRGLLNQTPEAIEKKREALAAYWASERSRPHRDALLAAQRLRWADPDRRRTQAENLRRAWTPERRAERARVMREIRAARPDWPTSRPAGDAEAWSVDFPCCVECGKTDQHHAGRGMCARCYRRMYSRAATGAGTQAEYNARRAAFKAEREAKRAAELAARRSRWSRKFDACTDCGGTESPHQGGGVCARCYLARYRAVRAAQ